MAQCIFSFQEFRIMACKLLMQKELREARRPLTQRELEDIAEHLFDELTEENETYFPSSDSEFSGEEIEQQTEDTDASEQENSAEKSEEVEVATEEFFIGKNKSPKWRKIRLLNRSAKKKEFQNAMCVVHV